MKTVLQYGIALGVIVFLWTAIVVGAGWHKDPVLLLLFYLVIPFEITLLLLALRSTAAAGASYGKQVLNGLGISVVGGVLIALGSVFLTTIVFPNYFQEIQDAGRAMMEKAGLSAENIESQLRVNASMYQPWPNALNGFIGTVATGLVVTVIAGAFLRKR